MRVANISRWFRSSGMGCVAGKMDEETGSSMVETALVIPLFVAMMIGAVEFGTIAYAKIEISNAAGAGAHYGMQSASNAGDVTGIQNAAGNEAPDITLGTTTVSHSCICSNGSSSTCLSTDCSTSHIETILTVQTQTTISPKFHLPGLPTSYTLYGQAVQKVMQ
jgi:Flp pilus assembly protein TadG